MSDKPLPARPRDSIVTILTYPETVATHTPGLRAAPGPPPPLPTQIPVGYERGDPTAAFHPYRLHRISPILSIDTSSSRTPTQKSIWPTSFRRKNSTGSAVSTPSKHKDKSVDPNMKSNLIGGWKNNLFQKWGGSSSPSPSSSVPPTYSPIQGGSGDPYANIHPISTGYPRDKYTSPTAPKYAPPKEPVPLVENSRSAYTRSEYAHSEAYSRSEYPQSEAYTRSEYPRSEALTHSEYPRSEAPPSEYPQSEAVTRSEYPQSEAMSHSEYPRSEAYTRSDYPRSDYPRSEATSVRSIRSGHRRRHHPPPPAPPIPQNVPSSSRRRNNRAPSRKLASAAASVKSWKTFPEPPPSTIGDTASHYPPDRSVIGDNPAYTDVGSEAGFNEEDEGQLVQRPPLPRDLNLDSPMPSLKDIRRRSRTNTMTTMQTIQTTQTKKTSRTGRTAKSRRTALTVDTSHTEGSSAPSKYSRTVGRTKSDGRRYSHRPFHYFHRHSGARPNQSNLTLTNASSMRNPSQIIRPGAPPPPMSLASEPSSDSASNRSYLPSRWARLVRLFRDIISLPWRGDVARNGSAPGITKTYNFRSGGGMGSGISPRPKRDSRIPRIPWYRPRMSQFPVAQAQGATVVPDLSEVFPRGVRGAGVGNDGSGDFTPTHYRMNSSSSQRISPTMQQKNPGPIFHPNIHQHLINTPSSSVGSHNTQPNFNNYFLPMHSSPSNSGQSPLMHKHQHALLESYQTSPIPGVNTPMSFHPDGSPVGTPPRNFQYQMSPHMPSGGPPSNSSGHSGPGIIIHAPGSGPIWVPTEPPTHGAPPPILYIVPGVGQVPPPWPEPQAPKVQSGLHDMPIGSAV